MSKYESIKLICPNKSCINKSIVYRKFDVMKEHRCKNCQWMLVAAGSHTKMNQMQNAKAKAELKSFGIED